MMSIFSKHPFQCKECGDKYTRKETLYIHMTIKHPKEMKCIVCDYKGLGESEITKHYEEVHLTTSEPPIESSNSQVEKFRNGPTCRYLKQNRCNFQHGEGAEQPWEQVHSRRSRRTLEHQQARAVQARYLPRQDARQVDYPRRSDRDLVERLRAYVQPAREAPRMEDTVTEVAKLILQAAGQGGRR